MPASQGKFIYKLSLSGKKKNPEFQVTGSTGLETGMRNINNLRYADDTTLIIDKTSTLKMISFSTVRVTQRGSQGYMEKRRGRRELEVTQMRWGESIVERVG